MTEHETDALIKELEESMAKDETKPRYYILDDNNKPIPSDILGFSKFCEEEWSKYAAGKVSKIVVKKDEVKDKEVSTVFLGLDHNYINKGAPLVFETMVFNLGGGCLEIYCERYSTYEEALAGHQKAVQWVKQGCNEEDPNSVIIPGEPADGQ